MMHWPELPDLIAAIKKPLGLTGHVHGTSPGDRFVVPVDALKALKNTGDSE